MGLSSSFNIGIYHTKTIGQISNVCDYRRSRPSASGRDHEAVHKGPPFESLVCRYRFAVFYLPFEFDF